jgi:hypothetical protein
MGRLRELYDNFRRTRRFHPKGILPPVLGDEMSSPLEKQAEAFFDELEKISFKFHPVALSAAFGAGTGAVKAVSNEYKERAKDVQVKLSPEELKANRARRMKGHVLGVAGSGLLGGGLGYMAHRQAGNIQALRDAMSKLTDT